MINTVLLSFQPDYTKLRVYTEHLGELPDSADNLLLTSMPGGCTGTGGLLMRCCALPARQQLACKAHIDNMALSSWVGRECFGFCADGRLTVWHACQRVCAPVLQDTGCQPLPSIAAMLGQLQHGIQASIAAGTAQTAQRFDDLHLHLAKQEAKAARQRFEDHKYKYQIDKECNPG